jgi:hypothetical protein
MQIKVFINILSVCKSEEKCMNVFHTFPVLIEASWPGLALVLLTGRAEMRTQ